MKKKLFTFLMIALAVSGLQAQDLQIHKTDGTIITVLLNAIDNITFFESGGDFVCGVSTVTDIDGNVYNTLHMGGQCWMKENLKTTTYKNGTPIPNVTDATAWTNLTTGAYVWYDNDINWKDNYGGLYNWFAVINTNGLCPTGWHVPSDDELAQLFDYVVAQGFPNQWENPNGTGNALKSCRQVNSPLGGDCNTSSHPRWAEDIYFSNHGFDEFGFSALPGGRRHNGGSFNFIGYIGKWWSSTEDSSTNAWGWTIDHNGGHASRFSFEGKTRGFTVRCLWDID